MIGIAILGITMAFAIPGFITMIANEKISSAANDFVGSLQLARAESVARISPTTICTKNVAGTGCAAGDWQQGWIVFADTNGDAAVGAGETIIMNHEALDPKITFNGTAGVANAFTYNSTGATSITATQVLIMCDDRGFAKSGKGILITITGRGSVMKATETGQAACL
jgi:type IV fimbrial biogenesis protein FimT